MISYRSFPGYFKIFSLLIAVFLFPWSNVSPVTFFTFLIILLLINLALVWTDAHQKMPGWLFAAVDFILALAAVLLNGNTASPYLLYLFSVLIFDALLGFPVIAFLESLVVAVLMLVYIFLSRELSFLGVPFAAFAFSFLVVVTLLAVKSDSKTRLEPAGEESPTQPEFPYLKKLNDLNALQYRIKTSYNLSQVYRKFLTYLQSEFSLSGFIIHYQTTEKTFYVSLDSEELKLLDISDEFTRFEEKLPDEIDYQGVRYHQLSKLPEVSIYIRPVELGNVDYIILKLASDFVAYKASEIYLEETEKNLLARFSSLYDAAKFVSRDIQEKPIVESAAVAIKNLTGMEKSIVCLVDKDRKISLESDRFVIKGRITQHPEDIWRQPFLKAAEECINHQKPVIVSFKDTDMTLLCVPMIYRAKVYGVAAGITSLTKEEARRDLRIIEIISAIATTSLANIDLIKERQKFAIAMERDRIAREMHDSLIQSLFSMLLILESSIRQIEQKPEESVARLKELKSELQRTIGETREYIYELYPKALTDVGLKSAVERALSRYSREGVNFEIQIDHIPENVPLEVENAALKIIQESAFNAVKHGKARNIKISVSLDEGNLEVNVIDDGKGFDTENLEQYIKSKNHFGIRSMLERTRLLGGSLKITSRPGKGTRVFANIPVKNE